MSTDGEPVSLPESRKDKFFKNKIDQIRSWDNFFDMPFIEGHVVTAGETVSSILEAYGYGDDSQQDWTKNISQLNPAVLDLGCGSEDDDQDRMVQWFPYVPVILGTHGVSPQRIIGVDLMPFRYAEGIYTHLTADLVSLVKSGNLIEFLRPHIPEGKFDAIVMNNFFSSPEMRKALREHAIDETSFRNELRSQYPHLLRPDGVIVYNGKAMRVASTKSLERS